MTDWRTIDSTPPFPANTNRQDYEVVWTEVDGHPFPVVLLDDGEIAEIEKRSGF